MTQTALVSHVRRGIDIAGSFYRWWLAELAGLIPSKFHKFFARHRSEFTVDLRPEGVVCGVLRAKRYRLLARVNEDAADAQRRSILKALAECPQVPSEIVVRLTPDQALQKTVTVPIAAEKDLRQVLKFDLGRQIPLVPDEVYFDFRIVEKQPDQQRLLVELAVVPRATIEHVMTKALGWGLTINRIGVADHTDEISHYNFLPQDRLRRRIPSVRRATIGLCVAAAVLGLAVIGEKFHHDSQSLAAMTAEIAAAKPAADRVYQLRQEIRSIAAGENFIPDKQRNPQALEVLNEFTRILPDGTWIFNFALHGSEMRAEGFSPTASSLISLLDESPLFANARFRSPVTQGAKPGIERFEVSCDLRRSP